MNSNRVLIYRAALQSGPAEQSSHVAVFWNDPRVSSAEIGQSIRDWSSEKDPVARVSLVTWLRCRAAYQDLLRNPLSLRMPSKCEISGGILEGPQKWHLDGDMELRTTLAAGYREVFIQRSGILVAGPGFHYEKPSGAHASKFLRAGNVLLSSTESSLFASGILTNLSEDEFREIQIIYTDTSAINTVGHVISDFLVTSNVIGQPLSVVSFGSYDGLNEGFNFELTDSSLVLMSATTTGALEEILESKYGIPRNRIYTLFAANSLQGVQVVFNTSDIQEEPFGEIVNFLPSKGCPMCDESYQVIKISGDHFLPESPVVRPFDLNVTSLKSEHKRFINDIVGFRAVLCNAVEKDEKQSLVSFTLFENNIESPAEHEIHRRFKQLFGGRNLKILVPQGSPSFSTLTIEDHILFTEEVSDLEGQEVLPIFSLYNDGGGVATSMALRMRALPQDENRVFLLGLSIFDTEENLTRFRRNLGFGKRANDYILYSVYEVLLPKLGSRPNPWQRELEWWRKTRDWVPEDHRHLVDMRMKLLKEGEGNLRGLRDVAFLPDLDNRPLASTKGFAFWDNAELIGTQADIFLTTCAVLHDRRHQSKSWGNRHNAEVLEPDMFYRFTDPTIQAALLRNPISEELNYSASREASDRFRAVFEHVLKHRHRPEGAAIGEFCLSILSDRVILDGYSHAQCLALMRELERDVQPWAVIFSSILSRRRHT